MCPVEPEEVNPCPVITLTLALLMKQEAFYSAIYVHTGARGKLLSKGFLPS